MSIDYERVPFCERCGHMADLHGPHCHGLHAGGNHWTMPDTLCDCPAFYRLTPEERIEQEERAQRRLDELRAHPGHHWWTTREKIRLCIECEMKPSHARNAARMMERNARYLVHIEMLDADDGDEETAVAEWLAEDDTYKALVRKAATEVVARGLQVPEDAF